jgi:hypothetical protein
VRGHEPLPPPASKEPMQGVRGLERLPPPAPRPKEHMQGRSVKWDKQSAPVVEAEEGGGSAKKQ